MSIQNLVFWVHGVESDVFNPASIINCIAEVNKLLPENQYYHHLINWNSVVHEREKQTYDIVKKRGNILTRYIRKAICFIGCDMWWTLATLKDFKPTEISFEVQEKIDNEIQSIKDKLYNKNYGFKIHIVAHSWGTREALFWIYQHPEEKVNFITLGCPLLYGSGCFSDWGDPDKLKNITHWVNIGISNDPISTLMGDNPNPKWKSFVKDYDIHTLDFRPLECHTKYWKNSKVQQLITQSLKTSP